MAEMLDVFSTGSGDSGLPARMTMVGANKRLGQMIQNFLMNKYYGLLTGAGTPQELPWFKQLQDQLLKSTNIMVDNIMRDAVARGIRGGTLEQLLRAPVESANQNLLRTIQSEYGQALGGASQLSQQAFQNWLNQANLIATLKAQQQKSSSSPFEQILGKLLGNAPAAIMSLFSPGQGGPGGYMGTGASPADFMQLITSIISSQAPMII